MILVAAKLCLKAAAWKSPESLQGMIGYLNKDKYY